MTPVDIRRSAHVAPAPVKPKTTDADLVAKVLNLLEQGKSEDEIRAAMQDDLAVEPINAGIIRTRKGALMVRVGDSRWPVAMYKRDWKILLSKVPAIEKALEELNILDENPSPATEAETKAA